VISPVISLVESPVTLPESSDLTPNEIINTIPKPNTDLDGSESDSEISSTALASIVIATIVFVALLGGMVFYMVKKKRKKDIDSSVSSQSSDFSDSDNEDEDI
jgi:hypothetical protein